MIALALAAAAPAAAQVQPPGTGDPGGFNNVLAVGQGGNTGVLDLARNQVDGSLPPSFQNQRALYTAVSYTHLTLPTTPYV